MNRACLVATFLLAISALLLCACGRKSQMRPPLLAAPPGMTEEGNASWYGQPYHGRPTASGETYDMEKLTAAHRTLPFGTRVRVESQANNRSVEVRINDRGPFLEDRFIDLSRAAARALDMIGAGTARVRLTVLSLTATSGGEFFAVQVGAFRDKQRAERLRREMEKQYGNARIVQKPGKPVLWRVLVGRVPSIEAADALARRIRGENSDKAGDAFVVHLD